MNGDTRHVPIMGLREFNEGTKIDFPLPARQSV